MSLATDVNVQRNPIPVSTGDTITSTANTAVSLDYAAVPLRRHCISGITLGVSAATATLGTLTLQDGAGNIVFSTAVPIGQTQTMIIPWNPAKMGTVNTLLRVNVGALGAGVTCQLSAMAHWTEQDQN